MILAQMETARKYLEDLRIHPKHYSTFSFFLVIDSISLAHQVILRWLFRSCQDSAHNSRQTHSSPRSVTFYLHPSPFQNFPTPDRWCLESKCVAPCCLSSYLYQQAVCKHLLMIIVSKLQSVRTQSALCILTQDHTTRMPSMRSVAWCLILSFAYSKKGVLL